VEQLLLSCRDESRTVNHERSIGDGPTLAARAVEVTLGSSQQGDHGVGISRSFVITVS
jgi:hypothetical protein